MTDKFSADLCHKIERLLKVSFIGQPVLRDLKLKICGVIVVRAVFPGTAAPAAYIVRQYLRRLDRAVLVLSDNAVRSYIIAVLTAEIVFIEIDAAYLGSVDVTL